MKHQQVYGEESNSPFSVKPETDTTITRSTCLGARAMEPVHCLVTWLSHFSVLGSRRRYRRLSMVAV